MIIIMLGAPGAGKGTQADILQDRLQMVHVSSGDLLRDHRDRGTELGKIAQTYMVRGELVPDDLVIQMIMERLEAPDIEHGILLDGFPRTLNQARALDDALQVKDKMVNRALHIKVDNETLIERLSGRWTCRNCGRVYHEKNAPPAVPGVCDACGGELYQRDDDKTDTVVKRLEVYFVQTMPIIEYYCGHSVLCEVDGRQPIETVTEELLACLR